MYSHRWIVVPLISLLCHSIPAMFFYGWPTIILITHPSLGIRVEINRANEGLLTVPHDVATNVTDLLLESNSITHTDFNSFKTYTELFKVDLSRNPLKTIADRTFENNHRLSEIICVVYAIESAPATFGPCTSKISKMDLKNGVVNSDVLLNFDLINFNRLRSISLMEIKLPDLNVLQLPPSIRELFIFKAEMSTLPQVGRSRFPELTWVYLKGNELSLEIPYHWFENISMSIHTLLLATNGIVKLPEILPVKPRLSFFAIENNRLLTIPDMLDFPALKYLLFRSNPITCDQKMCWKRLWNRKRAPLHDDDVMCQMPPFLRGTMLSDVNPKVMGCFNGN